MKQSHSLWYAAPSKIPADYDYTRTHPQTAAYSSWVHIYPSCMQIPKWARRLCSCLNTIYIPSVFFKHSPKSPFPPQCHIISRSTRWDTKLSSIILTSLWFRSCPIVVEVEKAPVGGENSSRVRACCRNAWTLYTCSITSSVLLRFTHQADGGAPLAIRHVRLGILQRWTNRAGRSATLGYHRASVPSKLCSARAQNSAEISGFKLLHSPQIDVECSGTGSCFITWSREHNFLQCHSLH